MHIYPIKKKYNKDDLLIDIQQIPISKKGIKKNIKEILKMIKSIDCKSEEYDRRTLDILEGVIPYIQKQSNRLLKNFGSQIDIIAWISRCLMELWLTMRYMFTSSESFNEVIEEQLKDLKDIEKVLYPSGAPDESDPSLIKEFHEDMKKLWNEMEKYGVVREELNRPNAIRLYAEKSDLLSEYNKTWRIHAKYVHPTSYLIFGKQSFVHSTDASNFFWTLAQYYLAWIVRDIFGMIEADAKHRLTK